MYFHGPGSVAKLCQEEFKSSKGKSRNRRRRKWLHGQSTVLGWTRCIQHFEDRHPFSSSADDLDLSNRLTKPVWWHAVRTDPNIDSGLHAAKWGKEVSAAK